MDASTLGQRIRSFRKKIGMTQKELAAAVGMSHNAISHYEKDEREPNIQVLLNIAQTLNVTGDALLGLEHPNFTAKSRDEYMMLRAFRNLNPPGRAKTLEYAMDLAGLSKYSNPTNPTNSTNPINQLIK